MWMMPRSASSQSSLGLLSTSDGDPAIVDVDAGAEDVDFPEHA